MFEIIWHYILALGDCIVSYLDCCFDIHCINGDDDNFFYCYNVSKMIVNKNITQLTVREKYEIVRFADKCDINEFICLKLKWALIEFKKFDAMAITSEMVQDHFDMHIIKPSPEVLEAIGLNCAWWCTHDPNRIIAWNTLLEYWKNKANGL